MLDLFGKWYDFKRNQEDKSGTIQLSDYSLYDRKSQFIYLTDEFGKMTPLALSNGRMLSDHLIDTEQIDVLDDMLDLILSIDTNYCEQ